MTDPGEEGLYAVSISTRVPSQGAGPEAWDNGQSMAKAIAGTVTEHDWAALLNSASTDRAARQIARCPAEERQYRLGLLSPERRVTCATDRSSGWWLVEADVCMPFAKLYVVRYADSELA